MTRPAITRQAEFLTMEDVAERMRVSRRTLQGLLAKSPCGKMAGRRRLFTERDVAYLYESLPSCPLNSSPRKKTGPRSIAFAAPTSGSQLTEALALATKKPPQKSWENGGSKSNVVPMPGQRR